MNTGDRPLLGRAPWTTAGELSAAQKELVDRVRRDWAGGAVGISPVDSNGRLTGPFDLMAASPHVGRAVLEFARSFRNAALTAAERELVILVVAAHEGTPYMWRGHEPVARRAGLTDSAVAAVGRRTVPHLPEPLAGIHEVSRRLCQAGDLDDSEFATAVARLGWPRLQEIVWLVGLYSTLALALRVARSPLAEPEAER